MVVAFILIVSQTGKEKRVVDELMKINSVKEASLVFGDYDVVAKLEADDVGMLNDVLINQIRKIPQISLTTTLIAV